MAFNPKNRKLDKRGNPIVTKEELEASGMSLRDFLNKERGLTRRVTTSDRIKNDETRKRNTAPVTRAETDARVMADEKRKRDNAPISRKSSKPNITKPMQGPAVKANPMADEKRKRDNAPISRKDSKPNITKPMQGPAVKANPMADQKDTDERVMMGEERKRAAAPISRGDAERDYKIKMKDIIKEKAAQERMDNDPLGAGMKKGGVPKYKPGGSVRGDGVAKRGKTRGRMC